MKKERIMNECMKDGEKEGKGIKGIGKKRKKERERKETKLNTRIKLRYMGKLRVRASLEKNSCQFMHRNMTMVRTKSTKMCLRFMQIQFRSAINNQQNDTIRYDTKT